MIKELFLFLLNYVYVVANNNPNAHRNKTGFILYAPDSPPVYSCLRKNKKGFNFLFYVRVDRVN